MRCHVTRLRLRTLLIAVPVVALAFSYWRRYETCQRRAAWYAIKAKQARNRFVSLSQLARALRQAKSRGETRDPWLDHDLAEYRRQLPGDEARMIRYRRLKEDWHRAAAFPWLPLPRVPDPPPPE